MAYQNTGAYRHRTLTVQPKKDGANFGAPIVYSILNEFTDPESEDTYLSMNATEFSKISDGAYFARRDAFLRFVNADPLVIGFLSETSFTNVPNGSQSFSIGLICVPPVAQGPGEGGGDVS